MIYFLLDLLSIWYSKSLFFFEIFYLPSFCDMIFCFSPCIPGDFLLSRPLPISQKTVVTCLQPLCLLILQSGYNLLPERGKWVHKSVPLSPSRHTHTIWANILHKNSHLRLYLKTRISRNTGSVLPCGCNWLELRTRTLPSIILITHTMNEPN